jgi:hypothetical protein
MPNRLNRLVIGLAGSAFALALALTSQSATGQAARPARTPDGKPNLNGIWQALNTANYDLLSHQARPAMAMRPGPVNPIPAAGVVALGAVGAVPGGVGVVVGDEIPYKPEALKKKQENQANWLTSDPEIKCYLPGVPRANYMPYPFQIVQGQKDILFVYEYASSNRIVHMDKPSEAPVDSWMGWSNGKWDGNTLVIEVTGNNDQTWFDRAGNHHTEALKVTERYNLMGDNHLQYEATIEDPKTFSKPWQIRMPLYRRMEPNSQLLEYKCVEFSEELLYGDLKKKTE